MYIVPNFHHLRTIEMKVGYKEMWLPQPGETSPPAKWMSDPDWTPDQKFPPQPKIYLNGIYCRNGPLPQTQILREAPPENWVPRRGLVAVLPGEPDYEELCKQQNIRRPLAQRPLSPSSSKLGELVPQTQQNGITPPASSSSMNGNSPHLGNGGEIQTSIQPLPNGVSEHNGSPTDTSPAAQ
jgi:hypothetical protein